MLLMNQILLMRMIGTMIDKYFIYGVLGFTVIYFSIQMVLAYFGGYL